MEGDGFLLNICAKLNDMIPINGSAKILLLHKASC